MKIKGLSGIANLLGVAFLAIALLLALTSPATVGAAPAAQTTATATATTTTSTGAAATATTSPATPSTLPTTGAADQSMALGLMTLVGLGFLGMGLALRAFSPKSTR